VDLRKDWLLKLDFSIGCKALAFKNYGMLKKVLKGYNVETRFIASRAAQDIVQFTVSCSGATQRRDASRLYVYTMSINFEKGCTATIFFVVKILKKGLHFF
jgi:hypothetical protein